MWAFPDHMPTLASPIEGIRTYHALTFMQMATLTTRLSVKMGISIIAILGVILVAFGSNVPGRSRIN